MAPKEHHHIMRDLAIIFASIIFAVYLGRSEDFERFLLGLNGFGVLAPFLAGFFFTSVFTTAPAIVALAELARLQPIFAVAALGAAGAIIADYILFRFVRDSVAEDIEYIFQNKRFKFLQLFKNKTLRWVIPFMGALIIASPLPDELGVAMLGISKTKKKVFLAISYFANFIGILAIGGVAGLL
jgi:hypothetical protein